MFGWIRSKRESKQSKRNKQKGKQNHPQSTRGNHKETGKFTHTTQKERDHMYDLRSQGFSVHAIAKKLSRSSRTVYQVLTERGTLPLPEPEDELPNPGLEEHARIGRREIGGRRRRRRNSEPAASDSSALLWKTLDPTLEQMTKDLLESNEDFALHVVAAHLGVKVPNITVDDMIQGEIKRDAGLRRRLAEEQVNRLIHMGKTETELAKEVIDLVVKISEWKDGNQWSEVVEKSVTSGEVRKIVEAFVGATSRDHQSLAEQTLPPPYDDPVGTALEPVQPDIKASKLWTAASSTPKTPTSQRDSNGESNVPLRPDAKRPPRKRHRFSESSPKKNERILRIIKQPVHLPPDKTNGSAPMQTFGPEIPDDYSFEL